MALGIAVVAICGVWAVQESAKRQQVWRDVARRRGATFHEPAGWLGGYAIEAAVGTTRVYLDSYSEGGGNSSTTYTRARARFPLPVGPRFEVYPEGVLSQIGKALGAQDVELGRPGFDEAFVVKCDYPALVQTVWTARALEWMERFFPGGRAVCDGTEVTLRVPGLIADPATLDAMLDLTGELAGADLLGIAALARLANATVSEPSGAWDDPSPPRAIVELPARVEVVPTMNGYLACTRVTGAAARAHPAFHTAIGSDGLPLADLPDGALPPAATAPLRTLAAGRLAVDRATATYWFPRIETNTTHLEAAIALIATFATAPTNIYR